MLAIAATAPGNRHLAPGAKPMALVEGFIESPVFLVDPQEPGLAPLNSPQAPPGHSLGPPLPWPGVAGRQESNYNNQMADSIKNINDSIKKYLIW